MNQRIKVMIAGIGGASLGTEICKSLKLAKIYDVFGCDISATAYGMYENDFLNTYQVSSSNYARNVLDVCVDAGVKWLIPGGEEPMKLLGQETKMFAAANIHVVANSPSLISICSNKKRTFNKLTELEISIPKTIALQSKSDLDYIGLPCIVKPSTGTGGSVSVFLLLVLKRLWFMLSLLNVMEASLSLKNILILTRANLRLVFCLFPTKMLSVRLL